MGNYLKKPSKNLEDPLLESQEEDANASFTCEICIEPVLTNKKFKNKNHCAHSFCKECIAKYIELKIKDHIASVQCPGLNCKRGLKEAIALIGIAGELVVNECGGNVKKTTCPNWFERSYCPDTNCLEVVVNECGGDMKKSKCPNCKRLFCFQCKLAWHAGYGCEESRSPRDRNDILFQQLVESKAWIKCPRCGYFVET
ncbi:hypothetical protein Patl1_26624 [Pistacia atlantica]|uniref:Uncharacterized protein n=1 Tax=Pistacia atlantica TaxID=434234 RepID=A0ACC1AYN5_9ROSI|nr:hypothetical protein Patl1_26624 [Pistacia atlantica]